MAKKKVIKEKKHDNVTNIDIKATMIIGDKVTHPILKATMTRKR